MKEIKYQQKYVRELVDMTIDLLHREGVLPTKRLNIVTNYSSVGLLPFLSRDSAECKRVYFCTRCSLGWRVHPKMTALDAFGCKGSENLAKCKTNFKLSVVDS